VVTGRKSQCDRVLEVLADGRPHTITEIHERAGTMRLNSRISQMRSRGHNIVCERVGQDYRYTLIPPLDEPEPLPQQTSGSSSGATPTLPPDGGAAQLQLAVEIAA